MRGTLPIVTGSILLLGLIGTVDPAEAQCAVGHTFTTYNDLGDSEIHTASGFVGPGATISDRAYGCFWSLGGGEPTFTLGNDGGARCGLATGQASSWWIFDPSQPAFIGGDTSHWNTTGTDGCITRDGSDGSSTDPDQCMIVLLEDNPAGEAVGYWALLTDQPDLNGNYELNSRTPGSTAIVLQPSPAPSVISWIRATDTSTDIVLAVASGGIFPLPYHNCSLPDTSLITGYRIYFRSLPAGAPVDADRQTGGWTQVPDPAPFDAPTLFSVTDCVTEQDVYVCVALTFESGFESTYCSSDAASPAGYPPIIQCGGPPVECTDSGECDDLNDCTTDSCEPGSRQCVYTSVSDLASCDDGAGVCCGGNCATLACSGDEECDDLDACTTDSCTDPGTCDSVCDNAAVPEGNACDGSPGLCCGGSCEIPECDLTADCDDSGTTCATVTCSDGGTCGAACNYPACADGDGCCGQGCTAGIDDDCVPAGAVPDRPSAGTVLTITKETGTSNIILDWGIGCAPTTPDYEIYEGAVGIFTSHGRRECSTSGARAATFDPGDGDFYYLIVPRSSNREGSYGTDSSGVQRQQAASACRVQELDACATSP